MIDSSEEWEEERTEKGESERMSARRVQAGEEREEKLQNKKINLSSDDRE